MNSKIETEKLNLFYGTFQALYDVDIAIPEKQVTAFIGPSGCGKSTLLKTFNRMNDLVEGCRMNGSVKIDGIDIYGNIDVNLLRKRVGMVFQKPNPFPHEHLRQHRIRTAHTRHPRQNRTRQHRRTGT